MIFRRSLSYHFRTNGLAKLQRVFRSYGLDDPAYNILHAENRNAKGIKFTDTCIRQSGKHNIKIRQDLVFYYLVWLCIHCIMNNRYAHDGSEFDIDILYIPAVNHEVKTLWFGTLDGIIKLFYTKFYISLY